MCRSIRSLSLVSILAISVIGGMTTSAMSGGGTPADGYNIHVQAPHMMADGNSGDPSITTVKGFQMKSSNVCV